MLTYLPSTQVDEHAIFTAFSRGFSDYIIQFNLSQDDFFKRMFLPEGNRRDLSFVALDGETPVGVILGGIRNFDHVPTMRCGTLAVDPDYRRQGTAQELFRLHKESALTHQCRQLFLEVIASNDKAISFYRKQGYENAYHLLYFSLEDPSLLQDIPVSPFSAKLTFSPISLQDTASFLLACNPPHINWQNTSDFLEKAEQIASFGAFHENKLIGIITLNQLGRIHLLSVLPDFRHRRVATALLRHSVENLSLSRLSIGFPNNSLLQNFCRIIGFTQDSISQYEMYLPLSK